MAKRSFSDWGWKEFGREFRNELLQVYMPQTKKAASEFLNHRQKIALEYIQANTTAKIPYYTGNLHDSIASVVGVNGRWIGAAYMPREAKYIAPNPHSGRNRTLYRSQKTSLRKRIYGMDEAIKAVRNVELYPLGITAALVVGVPYSVYPHLKGKKKGYLTWLEETYVNFMDQALTGYFRRNKLTKVTARYARYAAR